MLVVISPAKSLNLDPVTQENHTIPELRSDAFKLVKILREKSSADLQDLMGISEILAKENVKRFKQFKLSHKVENAKRAINTFMGDVYRGLNVADMTEDDLNFAQKHLRILSGLYGVLSPLDLIQPYRLEMGTVLTTEKGKTLYKFWDDKPTKIINKALRSTSSKIIVNLASDEYFKVLNTKKLKGWVLKVNFKEFRNEELKFISFSAKVARGMMARYIIKNRINTSEDLKGFNEEGYYFSQEHSSDTNWLFVR